MKNGSYASKKNENVGIIIIKCIQQLEVRQAIQNTDLLQFEQAGAGDGHSTCPFPAWSRPRSLTRVW
jgi:hypothetical protein